MSNGSRPIPLLLNHQLGKLIGTAEYDRAGALVLTFEREHALPRAQFFETMGNCGMRVEEEEYRAGEAEPRIIRAVILEWSFSPEPARIDVPVRICPGCGIPVRVERRTCMACGGTLTLELMHPRT